MNLKQTYTDRSVLKLILFTFLIRILDQVYNQRTTFSKALTQLEIKEKHPEPYYFGGGVYFGRTRLV
jgi:hypothetical protein